MRDIRGTQAENLLLVAHSAGGEISTSAADGAMGGIREAAAAARELQELGLADNSVRMSGGFRLTQRGHRVADGIEHSRISGAERRDVVQRALLRWVGANESAQQTEEFVGTDEASAWGVPFTNVEVSRAGDFLLENDLIRSSGKAGRDHLFQPRIKPAGIDAIDAPGLIRDWVRTAGSATYQDNRARFGDHTTIGGYAQGGEGHRFEVTQNITTAERNDLAEGMAGVLAALRDDAPSDLREHLADLEASARDLSTPKPSLITKMTQAFVLAAASDAGREVVEQLGKAASVLTG